jgi:signal transduction histidine kinase
MADVAALLLRSDCKIERFLLTEGDLALPQQRLDCDAIVAIDTTVDPSISPTVQFALAQLPERAVVAVASGKAIDAVVSKAVAAGVHECVAFDGLTNQTLVRAIRLALTRVDALQVLYRSASDLLSANRELSDFAHVLAHDLRSPVRKSQLLTDRLVVEIGRSGIGGAGPVSKLLTLLDDEMGQLERIMVSLLEYVSLREALPPPEIFDLRPVIAQAIAAARERHHLGPTTIEVSAPAQQLEVVASEHFVGRVLAELLDNAVVHHPLQEQLRIQVVAKLAGGRANLTISDNGRGVPGDRREHVFRPLERLARSGNGSGLGLAISRRIVDAYGGTIRIMPGTGEGTAVVIELPMQVRTLSTYRFDAEFAVA